MYCRTNFYNLLNSAIAVVEKQICQEATANYISELATWNFFYNAHSTEEKKKD